MLVRVSAPLAVSAASGLKLTVRVALCPTFSVNGKLTPDRVKPVPLTDAALTVTGAVPDEVSVTDRDKSDDTLIEPKLRLVELRVSLATPAPRLSEKLFAVPATVAVRVAVCAVLTVEIAAWKLALVEPPAMATEDGTVTAVELLDRVTT